MFLNNQLIVYFDERNQLNTGYWSIHLVQCHSLTGSSVLSVLKTAKKYLKTKKNMS